MEMPIKDGYEVMKYLKENNYSLPVIVISSVPDEIKLYRIGYSNFSYLSKPFSIKTLVENLNPLIL